jgi:phospholipase C
MPSGYKPLTDAEMAAITVNPRKAAAISHQEPGTRSACALPYELYAHGAISADGRRFELELTAGNKVFGSRSAGAPFNVYLRNLTKQPGMQAATYTVRAGDTLKPSFPLEQFHGGQFEIEVLAPNGFYRRFSGTQRESPAVVLTALEERSGSATGALTVHLHNPTKSPRMLRLVDNSYGAAAIVKTVAPDATETILLPLESSDGWYDFSVQAANSKAVAQFAGRLETGSPSRTDPLMGRA